MADPEVRFPETYVSGVPVWAKRRKVLGRASAADPDSDPAGPVRRRGDRRVAALGSVEKGGAVIDQWIALSMVQLEMLIKKF
jgi:hypothetical protein